MKNHLYTIRKSIFLLIGLLVASSLFIGCQQDPVDIENANLNSSNNAVVQGVSFDGTLPGGALYEIELPETWNYIPDGERVLLVYAHGYVDSGKPIVLPSDVISDGLGGFISIKEFILGINMSYASTSYRDNGLVVLDAIEDIKELKTTIEDFFNGSNNLAPNAIVLVGPSEGGLITVLTIEQNPGMFDAAIATCCPIGNFYEQLQYYGDAHVLFKYFFGPSIHGINLGSPKGVSKRTMKAWNDGSLKAAIIQELEDDYINNGGNKIMQFLNCANIPVDRSDPTAVVTAILELLRFPIMATNDAISRLEGSPYNNKNDMKVYTGSENDRKLNLTVERIKRSDWEQAAQNVANFYETTGVLMTPLVTMHTEYDHISFYEHQTYYETKVEANSPFPELLNPIQITGRYGHCNFTTSDIMQALLLIN